MDAAAATAATATATTSVAASRDDSLRVPDGEPRFEMGVARKQAASQLRRRRRRRDEGTPATSDPLQSSAKTQAAAAAVPSRNWSWEQVNWSTATWLVVTPVLMAWALCNVTLVWQTAALGVVFYWLGGLGITAGYHRLWSHRSYKARFTAAERAVGGRGLSGSGPRRRGGREADGVSAGGVVVLLESREPDPSPFRASACGATGTRRVLTPPSFRAHLVAVVQATSIVEAALLAMGTSAFEGSVLWWCSDHRTHHRFTDTDRDPYNSERGLFYSHVGWLLVAPPSEHIGRDGLSKHSSIIDLKRSAALRFQHAHYLLLAFLSGLALPALIAGVGWGDWLGGFLFAGVSKAVLLNHRCPHVQVHTHSTDTHDHTARITPACPLSRPQSLHPSLPPTLPTAPRTQHLLHQQPRALDRRPHLL